MAGLIDSIIAEDYAKANDTFDELVAEAISTKLDQARIRVAWRTFGQDMLKEYVQTVRRRGRLNYITVRVRSGKIQRRKKVSAVKGWTLRGGKLKRMRPAERLHRRLAARRAKLKRRAHRAQILRHTRIAMRKRRSLGLRAWSATPHRN